MLSSATWRDWAPYGYSRIKCFQDLSATGIGTGSSKDCEGNDLNELHGINGVGLYNVREVAVTKFATGGVRL